MTYHVYLWAPEQFPEFADVVAEFNQQGPINLRWSCGISTSIKPDDVAILRKVRSDDNGVVGIGRVTRGSYEGTWDDGRAARFVDVEWEYIDTEPVLTRDEMLDGGTLWTAQAGGTKIDDDVGEEVVTIVRDYAADAQFWSFLPEPTAFVEHWTANPPTESQRRMLVVHYWSPDRDMHPEYMAKQFDWPSADTSHLHYGRFAGSTAQKMGVAMPERADNVALFAGITRVDGSARWLMHDTVREAIELLGWHNDNGPMLSEDEEQETRFREGQASQRTVTVRSRSGSVRQFCLDAHGTACTVCRFDPVQSFGPEFVGIIEVHHLDPIAESDENRETDPVGDCRPLCPVCHRLAHLGMPINKPRTIDDIRLLREKARSVT